MSTILKALRQLEDEKAEDERTLMEQVVEPSAAPRGRGSGQRSRFLVGGMLGLGGVGLLAVVLVPLLRGDDGATRSAVPAATSAAPPAVVPAQPPTTPQSAAATASDLPSASLASPLAAQSAQGVAARSLQREAEVSAALAATAPATQSDSLQQRSVAIATPERVTPEPAASARAAASAAAAETAARAREQVEPPSALAREPERTASAAVREYDAPAEVPSVVAAREPKVVSRAEAPGARRPSAPRSSPPAASGSRSAARAAAPPRPASLRAPSVVVESTVWHPRPDRRQADLIDRDGTIRVVREGDFFLDYEVVEITPSAVVFGRGGQTVRRTLGASSDLR